MDIAELQTAVDAWIKTHGVRYFNELTNMTILVEEVGELARVIARKYGEQSYKEGEKDNLAEELSDVLWVLVCLAMPQLILRFHYQLHALLSHFC